MIYKYKNGNIDVSLDLNSGTKVREWSDNEIPSPEFPESIDIKITNKCDLNCPYCHEGSVRGGAHGNLDKVLNELAYLPKGIELAIGGGNPLTHPELPGFLRKCASRGHICNMTINQTHLKNEAYFYQVRQLAMAGLIYGIGISYNNPDVSDIDFLMKYTKNVVLHCIVGIHDPEDIMNLKLPYLKVLWLGYKNIGRGREYEPNKELIEATTYLFDDMTREFDVMTMDNLALEQLDIKSKVSPEYWSMYYQGDDFTSSMYIDAVEGMYAPSSTEKYQGVNWTGIKLQDYFKNNHR